MDDATMVKSMMIIYLAISNIIVLSLAHCRVWQVVKENKKRL